MLDIPSYLLGRKKGGKSALRFRGKVDTVSDLPTQGNKVGDLYYVVENGSEYAWIDDGTEERWEELGPIVDLSNYFLKTGDDLSGTINYIDLNKPVLKIPSGDGLYPHDAGMSFVGPKGKFTFAGSQAEVWIQGTGNLHLSGSGANLDLGGTDASIHTNGGDGSLYLNGGKAGIQINGISNKTYFGQNCIAQNGNAIGRCSIALGTDSCSYGELSVAVGNGAIAIGAGSFARESLPTVSRKQLETIDLTSGPAVTGGVSIFDISSATFNNIGIGDYIKYNNTSYAQVIYKDASNFKICFRGSLPTSIQGTYDVYTGLTSRATATGAYANGHNTFASGDYAYAIGYETRATGAYSYAEGYQTNATGMYSHAEGQQTNATYVFAHAEGYQTNATSVCSHAEGNTTTASGGASHAEGAQTQAKGFASHAEGQQTTVESAGVGAHAEGNATKAAGNFSHVEGNATETSSYGMTQHAEGTGTYAYGTNEHVQGKYNVKESGDPGRALAHVVGNGTADNARSNAHTLAWDGTAWFASDVYVGSTSGTNKDAGSKKLATEEYVDEAIQQAIQQALANLNLS